MLIFEEGQPEDGGIPTNAIRNFEGLLQKQRVRIHGFMMLSGRQIIAERYYAPYTKTSLHRMYSVTKSFVALAVGLLIKNGLVSLEDKICDYFPEKLPEGGAHPWCAEMTIRDMLCMQTCHGSTTYKRYAGNDWTESFFRVEPDHVPGTVFSYDTSSAHVLGALVEKLTGMKLLDYMRREMLDELGFSKEAYIIEDPVGVSQGGSGMMSTLRDMACVAYLCNHYGVLDGKELLPVDFMRDATTMQVPTDLQPKLDEQYGYGYFIWMPREEGFTFFGMGGQLAVCFPKYDFCCLTMADVNGSPAGVQILHDCFYQTVYPYLIKRGVTAADEGLPNGKTGVTAADEGLPNGKTGVTAADEGLSNGKTGVTAADESLPNGKTTVKTESHIGEEALIRASTQNCIYTFYPNSMHWENVIFDWERGTVHFTIPEGKFTFRFHQDDCGEAIRDREASLGNRKSVQKTSESARDGVTHWISQDFLNTGYRCECRGYWRLGHFILQCFLVDEEQGNVQMDFAWKDSRLSVRIVSTSDPFIQNPGLQKCFQGFASAEEKEL